MAVDENGQKLADISLESTVYVATGFLKKSSMNINLMSLILEQMLRRYVSICVLWKGIQIYLNSSCWNTISLGTVLLSWMPFIKKCSHRLKMRTESCQKHLFTVSAGFMPEETSVNF